MKKYFFLSSIFLIASVLFTTTNVSASSFVFQRNISIGATGEDVRAIQQILNRNTQTQISSAGAGSPGSETTYFGTMTRQAIVRFQELYAQEILIPVGLTQGTGFVGESTRKKLSSLWQNSQNTPQLSQNSISSPTSTTSSVSTPAILPSALTNTNYMAQTKEQMSKGIVPTQQVFNSTEANQVYVFYTSHEQIKAGDILAINGFGFKNTNEVHFGSKTVSVVGTTTDMLYVKVPSVSKGMKEIWVTNANGSSKEKSQLYVQVDEKTVPRPKLSESKPIYVALNDTVTVTGEGFDAKNNEIYSSLGVLKGISSQNNQLSFNLKSFEEVANLKDSIVIKDLPVYFRVKTEAGLSQNFGYFIFNGK